MTKRILRLLLAVLMVAVSLAGCGNSGNSSESGAEIDESKLEQYRDKIVQIAGSGAVTKNPMYHIEDAGITLNRLYYGEKEKIPALQEIVLGDAVFKARQGSTSPHTLNLSNYTDDKYFEFSGNSRGQLYYLDVLEKTKEPVNISILSLFYDYDQHFPTQRVDLDTAKKNALSFINDELIGNYGKNIDLSLYRLVNEDLVLESATGPYIYQFQWVRVINGITVHKIIIRTLHSGEVYECIAEKTPPEDILGNLPDLNPKEYAKLAEELIIEAYKYSGSDVTVRNVKINSDYEYLNACDPHIEYSHQVNKYLVYFTAFWEVSKDDGFKTFSHSFAIPIE